MAIPLVAVGEAMGDHRHAFKGTNEEKPNRSSGIVIEKSPTPTRRKNI